LKLSDAHRSQRPELVSQLGLIADVRSIAGSICQSIKGIRTHATTRTPPNEHGVSALFGIDF
jgi:hypothetical protein